MDDRGFILVESVVALMICSVALFTFLILFAIVVRANQNIGRIAAATQLNTSMMEEIRLRRWDQATPIPARAVTPVGTIGPDKDETSKLTFNDVDDFDGLTESPPVGPMLEPLPPSFNGFTRQVKVEFVDQSLVPSANPTDYKHVRVCSWDNGMNPVCLDTIFTNR